MSPHKEDIAINIILSINILKYEILVKVMLPLKQTNPNISIP